MLFRWWSKKKRQAKEEEVVETEEIEQKEKNAIEVVEQEKSLPLEDSPAQIKVLEERRRYLRLNRKLPVEYFINDNTERIEVFTIDISGGGMRIKNPFPIDSRFQFPMKIFLDHNDSRAVMVIAQAVWQKKLPEEDMYEIGLKFVQITDKDREFILKIIEKSL